MTSRRRRLVGSRAQLGERLDALLGVAIRRQRRRSQGQGFSAMALGGAVAAFVLGHPNLVWVFALLMGFGWVHGTTSERPARDEPQLRLLRSALDRLEVDPAAPLRLETGDEALGPWLVVGFLSPAGVRVTLRIERRSDGCVATATLEQDGQPRRHAVRAVGRWDLQGDRFLIDEPDAEDLAELLHALGGSTPPLAELAAGETGPQDAPAGGER